MFHGIGLNKDFRKMLSIHAEFKALSFKDVRTASDGTRKVKRPSPLVLLNFSSFVLALRRK